MFDYNKINDDYVFKKLKLYKGNSVSFKLDNIYKYDDQNEYLVSQLDIKSSSLDKAFFLRELTDRFCKIAKIDKYDLSKMLMLKEKDLIKATISQSQIDVLDNPLIKPLITICELVDNTSEEKICFEFNGTNYDILGNNNVIRYSFGKKKYSLNFINLNITLFVYQDNYKYIKKFAEGRNKATIDIFIKFKKDLSENIHIKPSKINKGISISYQEDIFCRFSTLSYKTNNYLNYLMVFDDYIKENKNDFNENITFLGKLKSYISEIQEHNFRKLDEMQDKIEQQNKIVENRFNQLKFTIIIFFIIIISILIFNLFNYNIS